jgi:hypothetical protein
MGIDLENKTATAPAVFRLTQKWRLPNGKLAGVWVLAGCLHLSSPTMAQPLVTAADSNRTPTHPAFKPAHYIVPTLLMAGGLLTQGAISRQVHDRVVGQYPNFTSHTDDIAQFAPTLAVLGLGAAGMKGQHAFGDQIALTALSHGLAQTIVAYPRPDGVGRDAFPSGHTTFVFTSAALLAHEYGGQDAW